MTAAHDTRASSDETASGADGHVWLERVNEGHLAVPD